MRADLDRFRKELGTDYIDILLLHCMTRADWPEERKGAMDVLEEAREKGIIRAHGVSCHTLEALKTAAKTPWVQVDLARINPIKAHMDADPATVISVLREMKKTGKGVIGMKIMAQGDLAHDVDRAVSHAVKLDCLDTFTIGFTSTKQLDEVVTKMPKLSVAST
jgi:predicted aldo/keto reductase-like oxidoreductase